NSSSPPCSGSSCSAGPSTSGQCWTRRCTSRGRPVLWLAGAVTSTPLQPRGRGVLQVDRRRLADPHGRSAEAVGGGTPAAHLSGRRGPLLSPAAGLGGE